MLDCYLVAVARLSTIDRATNTISVFHLVEQVQVSEVPAELPLEVHTYWAFEPADLNVEHEFRIVFIGPDGVESLSETLPLTSSVARFRMIGQGVRAPAFGACAVTVVWRRGGGADWTRAPIRWPLIVQREPNQTG